MNDCLIIFFIYFYLRFHPGMRWVALRGHDFFQIGSGNSMNLNFLKLLSSRD